MKMDVFFMRCIQVFRNLNFTLSLKKKHNIMAKSQDSKKNVKKEPAKTAKEKKADKMAKKASRK